MPTEAGGHKAEPELDRLSNILKTFNEQFGTLFTDTDRVAKRIRDDIAPKVAADAAYQNAKENTPHTARMAHDQALGKVMQHLLKDDTQVYKQFVENESFRRFVGDMVYALTSQGAHEALLRQLQFDRVVRGVAGSSFVPGYRSVVYTDESGPAKLNLLQSSAGKVAYATREDEVDRLLRGEIFVDLHGIIKQGIRASVEQYSLKEIEKFCDYRRRVPLPDANQARHFLEHQLELSAAAPELTDAACRTVEGYNEDDCRATEQVRNWLENVRAGMIASGTDLPRPLAKDTAPSEDASAHQVRVAALFEALTQISHLSRRIGIRSKRQDGCLRTLLIGIVAKRR